MGYSCVLLGSFLIAWLLPPKAVHTEFTVCFFRSIVGKPCPLCGLTRSFVHAAHGQFEQAWYDHPFWYLAATIVLIMGVLLAIDAAAGTDLWGRLKRVIRPWWPVIILILAVYGVVRLINT